MQRTSYNIVIADDDRDDQLLLREAINNFPFISNLMTVQDGAQLLDFLNHTGKFNDFPKENPDLILLDLNMPVMDGLTALRLIKKDKALKNIPIYILSTSKHNSDKQTCKLFGAEEFYTKPTEFHKLKDIVKDILSKTFNFQAEA